MTFSRRLTRARLTVAELAAGRTPGSVTLIAVSKIQPDDRVHAVLEQPHEGALGVIALLFGGAKLPKGIDFSIDYLRAGRPEETFAQCELVRVGARVALVQVRCWQSSPDRPIVVARGHFLLTDAQAERVT